MPTQLTRYLEDRTTINLFLPGNDTSERIAIAAVLARIKSRYGGFSELDSPVNFHWVLQGVEG